MKKEILLALPLLLAMAFPLSALAEHDPEKDLSEDSAVLRPPTAHLAVAPAGCDGRECLDAYSKYTAMVAGQEWNVPLYKDFLKRFGEVSSDVKVTDDSKELIVGSISEADWYKSYKYREGQMDKKAAWDGVVTMFQVERADFVRGHDKALKLYNDIASSATWKDGGQVKKELGRRLSDKELYGKKVLSEGKDGDGVRVFPGAMAAANLRAAEFLYVYLGPDGRDTLDSSYCKEKCAPGLVENIDKRNQLRKKGGKALADANGADLGSGPKFSEAFLKPAAAAAQSSPAPAADPAKAALDANKTPGYQLPKGFTLKDRGVPDFRAQTTSCAVGDFACSYKAHPFKFNPNGPAAPNLFQTAQLNPAASTPPPAASQTANVKVVADRAPAIKARPKPKAVVLQPRVKYLGTGPLVIGRTTFSAGQPVDLAHADESPMWFGALSADGKDAGRVMVSVLRLQPDARYVSVYDAAGARTVRIRIDSAGGYPTAVNWCSANECYPSMAAFRTLTVKNPRRNSKYDDDQFLMTLGADAEFQITSGAGNYTHYRNDPKLANDAESVTFGLLTGQWQGPMTQK